MCAHAVPKNYEPSYNKYLRWVNNCKKAWNCSRFIFQRMFIFRIILKIHCLLWTFDTKCDLCSSRRTPCPTSHAKRPATTIGRNHRRRPLRRPPDQWAANISANPAIRYRRPPRTTADRPPCCDTIASKTWDAKRSQYLPGVDPPRKSKSNISCIERTYIQNTKNNM